MTLALWLAAGIVAYPLIGNLLGRYSRKIGYTRSRLPAMLLFPCSAWGQIMQNDSKFTAHRESPVSEMSAQRYMVIMTYLWPVKIAWCSLIVPFFFLFLAAITLGAGLKRIFTGKGNVLLPHVAIDRAFAFMDERRERKAEALREAEQLAIAPPEVAAEPQIEQQLIEELARLRAENEILESRIGELTGRSEVEIFLKEA